MEAEIVFDQQAHISASLTVRVKQDENPAEMNDFTCLIKVKVFFAVILTPENDFDSPACVLSAIQKLSEEVCGTHEGVRTIRTLDMMVKLSQKAILRNMQGSFFSIIWHLFTTQKANYFIGVCVCLCLCVCARVRARGWNRNLVPARAFHLLNVRPQRVTGGPI